MRYAKSRTFQLTSRKAAISAEDYGSRPRRAPSELQLLPTSLSRAYDAPLGGIASRLLLSQFGQQNVRASQATSTRTSSTYTSVNTLYTLPVARYQRDVPDNLMDGRYVPSSQQRRLRAATKRDKLRSVQAGNKER